MLPTVTPELDVTAEPPAPQPAQATQPAPPRGTYWVRRLTRGINIASGVGQERAYSGEVACVPATIDRKANEITFTLGPFSFPLHEMGEHWTLGSPTLTHASPAFSFRGNTSQEIDRLDESSDEVVLTTVGALFREREACAHSTRFLLRCVGDACEELAPTERPFLLPACEQEMAEAERMRARVINVPDAALARTLTRADALIAHGGTLWEYVTNEAQCRTLTATPRKGNGVKFSQRYTMRDGRRVERETEFESVMPSARQAARSTDFGSVTFPDGSRSSGWSGRTIPSPPVTLSFGDQLMVADQREFYLTAASCRVRQAQGNAPALPAPFTRDAQ
ncbi:hypothetical protein [Polyangium mundeleinium]|uniref:Uncharacterized protein n=1 Tax=Polyangium mundeleinium TaxID=2995306 RepID=A0ABT5EX13_9BACT|nr:hypothetical protein [Polyangium mundeleinium]MDC0745331.1 hypothetical protein [Polyangium mundeleinium]